MPKDYLLLYILGDHARLREIEQRYLTFVDMCPPADRDLYRPLVINQQHHARMCAMVATMAGPDRHPPNIEWARERWEYGPAGGPRPDTHDGYIQWGTRDLFAPSPPHRRLELARHATHYETTDGRHVVQRGPTLPTGHSAIFAQYISPQLLLYRLICLFGMPPQRSRPVLGIWEARLVYQNGDNYLIFGEDRTGEAFVLFYGSVDASTEALDLIEHLLTNFITNEFSRTLAGGRSQNVLTFVSGGCF